jgi:hypothetical protein
MIFFLAVVGIAFAGQTTDSGSLSLLWQSSAHLEPNNASPLARLIVS